MEKNIFQLTLERKNLGRPPVWFMRQAGRYHHHYQELKKTNTFIDLCKKPELACETTMGPMRDFGFDAAILFSDLLFPLEVMGMGLDYVPGPKLGWHFDHLDKLGSFADTLGNEKKFVYDGLIYQQKAIELIRISLDEEFGKNSKGLIGFVGGPLTLYTYATTGGHAGDLKHATTGFLDGRYDAFVKRLVPLMVENMCLQAKAGPDAIAIFDTSAGEFTEEMHLNKSLESLAEMILLFKKRYPEMPIIYYSRGTNQPYWDKVLKLPIDCLGVDWRSDINKVLNKYSDRSSIQGNFDPDFLLLPTVEFKIKCDDYFRHIKRLHKEKLKGWVCGLGHGILQKTPEEHVRYFIQKQKEVFSNES